MRSHTSHTRGFSLIEVIVSIFIIGVIIIASATLLRGAQSGTMTREQDLALRIASNKIEALRAGGYAAVPASGAFADASLASLASGAGTITTSAYNPKTKRVDVSVSWVGQDRATHTVALTTLVTETGGL